MKTEIQPKRVRGSGLGRSVLTAGIAFGAIGAQSLFAAANYYWIGKGNNTLFSTPANWGRSNFNPTTILPVEDDYLNFVEQSVGMTMTIDREFKTGRNMWFFTSQASVSYDPDKGVFNPLVWEATAPEYGISHSAGSCNIGNGHGTSPENSNFALVIRSGTYTWSTGGTTIGGSGGKGYLAIEGGKFQAKGLNIGTFDGKPASRSHGEVVIRGGDVNLRAIYLGYGGTGSFTVEGGKVTAAWNAHIGMANGTARGAGDLVVGSGDANRTALFDTHAADCSHIFWVLDADGATGRFTIKKGGVVKGDYFGVQGDDATLVLDGGTLCKTDNYRSGGKGATPDASTKGYLFGYNSTDHSQDKNLKFLVTENGGTFNLIQPARFVVPLRLADGATFGRVRNLGPAKLTLDEIGEGVGIAFGAESEMTNVEVGGTVLPTLEISGGAYLASSYASLIEKMPAHAGKVLVSHARFLLPVNVVTLRDGVPVETDFNVSDFLEYYELAEGVRVEDIIVPEPVEGFEFKVFVNALGMVSYVPCAVSGLPAAYTPLAFIRATGDQHILAGCELGPDESVDLNFGDVTYVKDSTLFGQDAYAARSYLFCMQDNIFRFYGQSLKLPGVEANADYRLEVTAKTTSLAKIGDAATTINSDNAVETANRELSVFGLRDGSYRSKYSLYGLKVRASFDMLLHNFVPCLNERGEPGLFDTVEHRFFGKTGTKRFVVPGEVPDYVPIDDTDLLSEVVGTTLVVKEGLLADLPSGVTLLSKTTPFPVDVSTVKTLPAVTVGEGALSVEDGEANTYVVNGALKLMGGARLAVDLTKDGCDMFDATSVDLSEASSENPIYIIANTADVTALQRHKTVIADGISPTDLWKFRLVGNAPVKLRVYGNSLVLVDQALSDGLIILVH